MRKFDLGQTFVTKGVWDAIGNNVGDFITMNVCLSKHHNGDWGNLDEEDKMLNDIAVEDGGRILSAYEIGENKVKIWIITEADRSYTTILLPEEY